MDKKAASKKNNGGEKPVYKKWWFWAIIVVALIVIGSVAGSSNDAKKVEDDEITQSAEVEETKNKFKLGEAFEIDGMQLSVDKIERNYIPEYNTAKDGKEFVRVTVTYTNKSTTKQPYNAYNWKIGDSTGNLTDIAIVINEQNDLESGELQPNGTHSGTMVFEVPKGDQSLTLHYTPNPFITDREVVIELQ